jgi:hypothetical protein
VEIRGLDKRLVSLILLGRGERQRYVQDTPILPDVWQAFAKAPAERHDLLVTPLKSRSAIAVMRALRDALGERLDFADLASARLAPLQSFVGARLTFDELINVVLPRTEWVAKARKRFGSDADALPFDPQDAFEQVIRAARGLPPRGDKQLRGQLFEIARVLTLISAIYVSQDPELAEIVDVGDLEPLRDRIVEGVVALIGALGEMPDSEPLISRITSNRPVDQASLASRVTVKADAATRLFEVQCKDITWAVLDSGIDQKHPAFREDPEDAESKSRVVASYELGLLRELLNAAYEACPEKNPTLDAVVLTSGLKREDALKHLERAYRSYETEILDWSSIEPLVRLDDPEPPADGHGTHVAGIIGANWVEDGTIFVKGLCPDIRLMDFRIIGSGLDETEFAVLGALQLVRYLNSHNQHIVVHGVNLSLSIPHKVGSFACGRTPVCNECTRLVGAGVTVVAAAGNLGYRQFSSSEGEPFHAYSTLSITDPGNAEDVITVGATHRLEPHAYGISYFSSRGPTPDGRSKPDLVAPGERIVSTLPDEEYGPLDGTSQAAPHVSAAAAMLMARYPELNNEPRTIKKILCESATDLGRERAFQGHGLLDILRALQSF